MKILGPKRRLIYFSNYDILNLTKKYYFLCPLGERG